MAHKNYAYNLYLTESNKKKEANNYELAKERVLRLHTNSRIAKEDLSRYDENLNLYNGRWPELEIFAKSSPMNIGGKNFGIPLRHHGLIDQVCADIYGKVAEQGTNAFIKDLSPSSKKFIDRKRAEITRDYYYNTLIRPREEVIKSQMFQEIGIQDINSLSPEEQVQVQKELASRIEQGVPQDLYEELDHVSSPEDLIYSKFLNHIFQEQNLEKKFLVGAEYNISVAEEYYKVFPHRGHPTVEVLRPKYVNYNSSENVTRVEDGSWATYEQYLTPEDVISKYGHILVSKDLKDLEHLFIGNTKSKSEDNIDHFGLNLTEVVADNPHIEASMVETLSREGQDKLQALYNMVSGKGRHSGEAVSGQVREVYVTWKWTQWMYEVERVINGKKDILWKAGHYKKNPSRGDVKVTKRLVPQVWHAVVLGSGKRLVLNIEPVPFQYKNLNNPFDVKLTIFGGVVNTIQGDVRNSSFVDRGKQGNYEYNVFKARVEQINRNNRGKVLLYNGLAVPDTMNPDEWEASLSAFGIAPKQGNFKGSNFDKSPDFETYDLTNRLDENQIIARLEHIKNETYESMLYNKAAGGDIGQYATATNSQLSVASANRQLAKFFETRRGIKESVLDWLVHLTINLYKDNDEKKAAILDDYSRAYLEANYDSFHSSYYELYVVDDYKEAQKLYNVRNQLFSLTQNGATPEEVIEISDADSMADLKKWARVFTQKRVKADLEKSQREQQLIQANRESEMEMRKFEAELQMRREAMNNEVKLAMAEIQSSFMQRGQDVNRNNQADSIEKEKLIIESKEKIEREKLASKERIKDKEIRNKEKTGNK